MGPQQFPTRTVRRCLQIVEAKLNGQEIEVVEPEPAAKVVDLMEALKASVAAAKKEDEPACREESRRAKKTAAKKPAAKKPAPRKKAVGE